MPSIPLSSNAAAPGASSTPPAQPLSKGPVLGWSSFAGAAHAGVPAVSNLPHRQLTTSGRAAIHHALTLCGLPAGSGVLVPTYHCPTMVAPVLRAGLKPVFYAIDGNGLPQLDSLRTVGQGCGALLVSHFFGRTQSLAAVRAWCDATGVLLIEDCAHCLFGHAGERQVGAWGDYATASLSKFLPVPEGGVLASATRALPPLQLRRRESSEQLRGLVDLVEHGAQHRRFDGLNAGLRTLFALKNAGRASGSNPPPGLDAAVLDAAQLMEQSDMGRIDAQPLWVTRWLDGRLPRAEVVARRRHNFNLYRQALQALPGARPLYTPAADREMSAPYVFPLWVDDGDRVYQRMRELRQPVFRWDRIWPGATAGAQDAGPLWSRHVMQLLCHQDLSPADITNVADTLIAVIANR